MNPLSPSALVQWDLEARTPASAEHGGEHGIEEKGLMGGGSSSLKYYDNSFGGIKSALLQLLGLDDDHVGGTRPGARVVSDAIVGLADGLTVPFALTAGLSSVGGIGARTVVYAGLAELVAGAVSMGLGGYLGARSEHRSWKETRRTESYRAIADPDGALDDVKDVFRAYGVAEGTLDALAGQLAASPRLADFVMEFHGHHGAPDGPGASTRALTMAAGYALGGLLPLLPYFFVVGRGGDVGAGGEAEAEAEAWARWASVAVMVLALFAFGFAKTCALAGWRGVRAGVHGGIEMVCVGGAAAGSAVALVNLFEGLGST